MSRRKLWRLTSRLASGDVDWLLHRLRLAFGLRGLVPRPAPLVSRCVEAGGTRNRNEDTPPRVLVFSHNLEREGASISLKELICGLKNRHGISSEVIAFGDGPLRDEYEALGIAVEAMPSMLHRISTAKRLNIEVGMLAKRIQASCADVVFVNTLLNFPAVLAAEEAGVPSIWNPRESEPWDRYFNFLPNPVAQQAIAAIGLPRKVVFVAEATRAVWKDFEHSANFTVIHNALNTLRFSGQMSGDKASARRQLGWNDEEIVFLSVGTLCERKGQLDALQALETIAGQLNVPVRLIFVGDFSERYAKDLRKFALRFRSGTRINVDFVESTTAIGSYYLAADVFILCSRVESYPRVILEALAFGLPIISTPVFGVVEQITEPTDAFFYEPGDIALLGEKMLELANNPAARHCLAQRSKDRFSGMRSFEQMLSAYDQVLREASVCVIDGGLKDKAQF